MNAAASLARNSAALAMSSGWPTCGSGWAFSRKPSTASLLAVPFQTIGVETPPGAMAFTRMKSQASCSAAERVRFTTPALAAQ